MKPEKFATRPLLETRRRIQEHLDRIARQISIRAVRRTRQRCRPLGRGTWSPAEERIYRSEIELLSFERLVEIDTLTRMLERQDRAIEITTRRHSHAHVHD